MSTRKDPYKIRRNSAKEFSRVFAMMRDHLLALEERIEKLEKKQKRVKSGD